MLIKLEKVEDLFKDDFKKLIEIYRFNTIRKYINYRDYLFVCDICQDEISTNITISSDWRIFYNDSYNKLNKDKLKNLLDSKIKKDY